MAGISDIYNTHTHIPSWKNKIHCNTTRTFILLSKNISGMREGVPPTASEGPGKQKMNVLVLLQCLLFFQEGMCVCVCVCVLDKLKGLARYLSVPTKDKAINSAYTSTTQHAHVFFKHM